MSGFLLKKNFDVDYGFVVRKRTRQLVIDFKVMNERMCVLKKKEKFFSISIANVNAPKEEISKVDKKLF